MRIYIVFFSLVIFYTSCYKRLIVIESYSDTLKRHIAIKGDSNLISSYFEFMNKFEIDSNVGHIKIEGSGGSINVNGTCALINQLSYTNSYNDSFLINKTTTSQSFHAYHTLPNFYGSIATFRAINSSINWQCSFYVPTLYSMSISGADTLNQVSKTSGMTINWETDPNPLNNKGVFIELWYNGLTSHAEDSTMSNQHITKNFIVPDNGIFQVTPSMLRDFPNCPYLTVTLTKGNYISNKINNLEFPVAVEITKKKYVGLIN